MIKISKTDLRHEAVELFVQPYLMKFDKETLLDLYFTGSLRNIMFILRNPHYLEDCRNSSNVTAVHRLNTVFKAIDAPTISDISEWDAILETLVFNIVNDFGLLYLNGEYVMIGNPDKNKSIAKKLW